MKQKGEGGGVGGVVCRVFCASSQALFYHTYWVASSRILGPVNLCKIFRQIFEVWENLQKYRRRVINNQRAKVSWMCDIPNSSYSAKGITENYRVGYLNEV